MTRCPNGCDSADADWCSQCGARVSADPVPTEPVAPRTAPVAFCPSCRAPFTSSATFCESCGLDRRSGKAPERPTPRPPARPRAPGKADHEVVVTTDPASGLRLPGDQATVVAFDKDELLVGRTSRVRDVTPDVAVDDDAGISHRHAKLSRTATGFSVSDLGSANGTRLNGKELTPGLAVPLEAGDVLQLGKWTKLTIRPQGG